MTAPAPPPRPVWRGDWVIPGKIVLPWVSIRVKVVPGGKRSQLDAKDGTRTQDACWVYEYPGNARIYLDGRLPIENQRYALLHEMQHAHIEAMDVMLEYCPDTVQTKSMTALAAAKEKELIACLKPSPDSISSWLPVSSWSR